MPWVDRRFVSANRIKDRNCTRENSFDAHKARHSRVRVRIVIMHRFEFSAPDSSTLLITIRADCAKLDETGIPVPPPRGKTRVEWRSGASAGPGLTYTRRELFAAQKTPCRCGKRAGGMRGRKNMKRNNWNWAWCQRAHTISAKSLLTLRDLAGRRSGFSRRVYLAQKCREREKDRYVSYRIMGYFRLGCRCYTRSISAVELCNGDF